MFFSTADMIKVDFFNTELIFLLWLHSVFAKEEILYLKTSQRGWVQLQHAIPFE